MTVIGVGTGSTGAERASDMTWMAVSPIEERIDGLMLSFLTPESAVLAAVELLTIDPDPLRLRVGIHQGEALVVRDDVVGHVVNVAARITEQAGGGVALVSVDVRDAVGELPGVAFARARRLRLKGVDPISVCPVRSR